MSIEAHKCNQKGCEGHVVFENADFDFKNIPTNEEFGFYSFDEPKCNKCGKEFLVAPHYVVIDPSSDCEVLESACMSEVNQ